MPDQKQTSGMKSTISKAGTLMALGMVIWKNLKDPVIYQSVDNSRKIKKKNN